LLDFLDDTISTHIPPAPVNVQCTSDAFYPCSVRCHPDSHTELQVTKDFHNLVEKCQSHKHMATCYKRGDGECW
jgi:hypothetical protein